MDADFWIVDGVGSAGNSPTLTVNKGCVYTFDIQTTSDHPFLLTSDDMAGNEVTGWIFPAQNPATGAFGTTVTIIPPDVGTVYYFCVVHLFHGVINIVEGGDMSASSTLQSSVLGMMVMLAMALFA
jgi:hypothetical protein